MIQQSLAWDVGRGNLVYVGIDPISGIYDNYSLSPALFKFFHERQLMVIRQFFQMLPNAQQRWLSSKELCLEGDLAVDWDRYSS